MITGEIKQKVDAVWQTFWNNNFSVPITILEQMTYLFFMKLLDDKQLQEEANANLLGVTLSDPTFKAGTWHNPVTEKDVPYSDMRWHIFRDMEATQMLRTVRDDAFVFLRHLGHKASVYSEAMRNTVFLITDAKMLTRVVEGIDALPMVDTDTMGDVYEYMLSKMAAAGTNGQFRTPRHIIRLIVELIQPTLSDTICDPAMGSAGFLMEAARYIKEHQEVEMLNDRALWRYKNEMFNGADGDDTMMRIGCMNLMLHDVDNPQLHKRNSLSDDNTDADRYTLCLANPPFAGSLDADDIAASLKRIAPTKKTELLFVSLFIRSLRLGGRCASIVPDGVLFGNSKGHKSVRKELVENQRLQAVISMPSGVFQPYSGVSTAILIFTKTNCGGTDKVWFYDMKADGYSLDQKRTEVKENDIPDIINRFSHLQDEESRSRKEQSFLVPIEEIRQNGYDLSINKYKEVERVRVEYESPDVILERIELLEGEIAEVIALYKQKSI